MSHSNVMGKWSLPKPNYEVGTHDPVTHAYFAVKDGKRRVLPGVTNTLAVIGKPALIGWASKVAVESMRKALMAKVGTLANIDKAWVEAIVKEAKAEPNRIKEEAADIGTRAHALFERVFRGDVPRMADVEPELRPALQNFLDWLETSGYEVVAGDTVVASWDYGYGGRLDCILRHRMFGHLALGDYKTSSGIYPEMALQVAAYRHAAWETYSLNLDHAFIIRLDKKQRTTEIKQIKNLGLSLSAFLCAKDLKSLLEENQYV